jgi:hypothetical protein
MQPKKVTFSSRRTVFLVERYSYSSCHFSGGSPCGEKSGSLYGEKSGSPRSEKSNSLYGEKSNSLYSEKKENCEKKQHAVHYVGDIMYKLYTNPKNHFIKTRQVGIILFSACEDEVLLLKRDNIMKLFYDSDIDFAAAVFRFSSILKIDPQNTDYVGITNDGDVTFFVFMLKDVTPYYVMPTKRTKSCFRRPANVSFVQLELIKKNDLEQYKIKFDERTIKNCERARIMLKYGRM